MSQTFKGHLMHERFIGETPVREDGEGAWRNGEPQTTVQSDPGTLDGNVQLYFERVYQARWESSRLRTPIREILHLPRLGLPQCPATRHTRSLAKGSGGNQDTVAGCSVSFPEGS